MFNVGWDAFCLFSVSVMIVVARRPWKTECRAAVFCVHLCSYCFFTTCSLTDVQDQQKVIAMVKSGDVGVIDGGLGASKCSDTWRSHDCLGRLQIVYRCLMHWLTHDGDWYSKTSVETSLLYKPMWYSICLACKLSHFIKLSLICLQFVQFELLVKAT